MDTLDMPSYPTANRLKTALREQLQRALATSASCGDTDNGDLLKILRLRKEKADLLGRGALPRSVSSRNGRGR